MSREVYVESAGFTKELDNLYMEKYNISEIVLMENAAISSTEIILKKLSLKGYFKDSTIIKIICSCGNNGGDGFAIARHLDFRGYDVSLYILGNIEKMTPSAKANFDICKSLNINIKNIENMEDVYEFTESKSINTVVIDCIFGTGLNREVGGVFKDTIDALNGKKDFYVVSIDAPSGLDSSNGKVWGVSVKADLTITFEFYKKGFLSYGSEEFTGEIEVAFLGINGEIKKRFLEERKETVRFIDKNILKNIPVRNMNSHKGSNGRCVLVCGSGRFTGAAKMSSKAAVKTGSGLTSCICDDESENVIKNDAVEYMVSTYTSENADKIIENADAIGMGAGFGNGVSAYERFDMVFENIGKRNNKRTPVIIDADALMIFRKRLEDEKILNFDIADEENENLINDKKYEKRAEFFENMGDIVITPHPGELSSLMDVSISEINSNRVDYCKKASRIYNSICVLKGKNTVICDNRVGSSKCRVFINPTGNSSMANGGMGDCLLGIISSFAGMKIDIMKAVCLGVYMHGEIGDIVSEEKYNVTASDIIEYIPYYMKKSSKRFIYK